MIVSIMQPAYLPWLGYFDRILRSDLHIVLDHVQLEHNSRSFTNRNRIRLKEGWAWLTVPIRTKGRHASQRIDEVEIDATQRWAERHMRSLESAYRRAPFFAEHAPRFAEVYTAPPVMLAELNRAVTAPLLAAFGITTPLRYSSAMDVPGAKAELILNLCRAVGARTYLSGPLGRDYLDPAVFEAAGIALAWHDYVHPAYRQAFPGFEPYMSAVDLLFNHGAAGRDILSAAPAAPLRHASAV